MFCNWRCQREYRPLFVLRGGQTSADIASGQKPGIIGNKGNRVIHHGSVLQCCSAADLTTAEEMNCSIAVSSDKAAACRADF